MRIGLDFDNTLAIYDNIFKCLGKDHVRPDWSGSKKDLKNYLNPTSNGQLLWQKIQGMAYGQEMHRAQLADGVANFLLRAKYRNCEVFIVSHKTRFGHYDESKTPLREVSLKWMQDNYFFSEDHYNFKRENVFFLSERSQKIQKITELKLDFFIDDLIEVLGDEKFPPSTKKILFGCDDHFDTTFSSENWDEISKYIFGQESIEDIKRYLASINENFSDISQISGGGNSKVYRGKKFSSDGDFLIKRYPRPSPSDLESKSFGLNRLHSEISAGLFLLKNNIQNIRKPISFSEELNIAMFNWIDGDAVNSITDCDIHKAVQFIVQLKKLSRSKTANSLPSAREAHLSIPELLENIVKRENRILKESPKDDFLLNFFNEKYFPLKKDILNMLPFGFEKIICDRGGMVLSPSDFGFHNCLKDKAGNFIWYDFEYFGWDDPVKLTSDFLWHPAMILSAEQKSIWVKQMFALFRYDEFYQKRFDLCHPLFGLKWALISLNEFIGQNLVNKVEILTKSKFSAEQIKRNQLEKSNRILQELKLLLDYKKLD
jgi:hypothetical protein